MKNTEYSTNNKIYDVIIVGAGASGLFAAASTNFYAKGNASYLGDSNFSGLILEKTPRAGTKLLMSGSGQCNITHAGSIKDFVSCYGDKGKKIRSCLYKHSNVKLMEFLEENGVKVFTRENGKVFPVSMDAHDVLYMLLRLIKKNGFEIRYDSAVTSLEYKDGIWSVYSSNIGYRSRSVVIATGGCSYPTSGSDGSMFKVVSDSLDIKITDLKPSLTPIQVNEYPYTELSGIAFEDIQTSIWHGDKKLAEACEDLLFTHKDLSGPSIINISKYAIPGDKLKINYVYPFNYEQVMERLKKSTHGNKGSISNILSSEFGLPKRFSQRLVERHGEGLKKLAQALTSETFTINSVSGFNKAMATAGGIDLSQIDMATFGFKEYPGLYAIGEALDVDGITGGYNLQFAYSSAMAVVDDITKNTNGDR